MSAGSSLAIDSGSAFSSPNFSPLANTALGLHHHYSHMRKSSLLISGISDIQRGDRALAVTAAQAHRP
jgi:hypothetical protein